MRKRDSAEAGLLHLSVRKTKTTTAEEINTWNIDNEHLRIVRDFTYLSLLINSNEDCHQVIERRLIRGRAAVRELEKITSKNVSLETKAKSCTPLHSQLLGTDAKFGHWRRLVGEKNDPFEIWCWRRAVWIPSTARKVNKYDFEQIESETLLETKMIKLKLSYLGTSWEGSFFFWKDNIARGNWKQQEKWKTRYEMDWLCKRHHSRESTGAEQGCWGQNTVGIAHSQGHQELGPTQWPLTHTCVGRDRFCCGSRCFHKFAGHLLAPACNLWKRNLCRNWRSSGKRK